ncbi:MAG: hypothetical protein IKU61_02230 [Clostridia bacterium]|nr:hypothetical protein [Clostridia bacterium]
MKNTRKILTLVLAVAMSAVMLIAASGLEIFIIASSDEYESYATSAKYLEVLEIMKGYEDGDLHLEEPILRYQAALLFSRVITGVVDDAAWGEGPSKTYTDVPEYGNVMDLISSIGVIRGYGNKTFGYNDGIRYQDMCAMFIRALGYETENMAYPMGYVLKVEELGFGLSNVLPADYLNRGQVAQMLYDALVTEIADEYDEKLDVFMDIFGVEEEETEETTADTYIERNFNVSERKQFMIVATENYVLNGVVAGLLDVAGIEREAGYFYATDVSEDSEGDVWTFKIEGEAVNGVKEADLIGKFMNIVFDDRTPTAEKLASEDIAVVHADMVKSEVYENVGELSYVKFSKDEKALYLGSKRVEIEDLAPAMGILTPANDDEEVYDLMALEDYEEGRETVDGLLSTIKKQTYFSLELVDFDKDGEYDIIFYTPYEFGQYARRRYSGFYYTMVGEYSDTPVYNISATTEKTDANKTHFIEKFLVTGEMATKMRAYCPEDIRLAVGDEGKYSLDVTLTGEPVKNGDFVIYTFNRHTKEFNVVENLGTFQTGTLTGLNTRKQTLTIDGSAMSLGLAGGMVNANGLLIGDEAFPAVEDLAKDLIEDAVKGEINVRFLEYDAKLVYLEKYTGPAAVTTKDYVIVDVDASIEAAEKAAEGTDEEAYELIFGEDFVTVKALDTATGELYDVNVETIVTHNVAAEPLKFTSIAERHFFGTWTDWQAATAIRANGSLYYAEDEDENGKLELYAYGSEEFAIPGAGMIAPENADQPTLYFNYGKSNFFIDKENEAGISVDRVSTDAKSVTTIIGADGYLVRKGNLETNAPVRPNELYFSAAALVLEAGGSELVIFDPVKTVKEYDAQHPSYATNVYDNNQRSIWAQGENVSYEGYSYYLLLEDSVYVDTGAYLDAEGNAVTTKAGDPLYVHTYTGLYNVVTGETEDVAAVSTESTPVLTDVEHLDNFVNIVLRVDAEEYDVQAVTLEEVYVANDIYRNAGFSVLRQKDWITVNLAEKDIDGNGSSRDEGEESISINHNTDGDKIYSTLDGFTYTFIDYDFGASVDPEEFNLDDSFVFYNATDANLQSYSTVHLEDREQGVHYSASTVPTRRLYYQGTSYEGEVGNGVITTGLKNAVVGKVHAIPFFSHNNWSDYYIPAVDDEGDTIWKYEGSLKVMVRYHSFGYYDEEANTLDMIVVRVGIPYGVISDVDAREDFMDASDMVPAVAPSDPDNQDNQTQGQNLPQY